MTLFLMTLFLMTLFCSRQKINLPGTKVSPHVVRSRRCRCRRRRRRRCRIQM